MNRKGGFDWKRIVLYFCLSAGVSSFSSYAFAKKMLKWDSGNSTTVNFFYDDDPGAAELAVNLPTIWPESFQKAEAKLLPIEQGLIDVVHPSLDGNSLYYSVVAPAPNHFHKDAMNFRLLNYHFETRKIRPVDTVGYKENVPVYFTPDGAIVYLKHDTDTNGDGVVGIDDNDSVWMSRNDAKGPQKLIDLDSGMTLHGLDTAGMRLILSDGKKVFFYDWSKSNPADKVTPIFEDHELAFSLRGDNWFICYKDDENQNRDFFHFSRKKDERRKSNDPQFKELNPFTKLELGGHAKAGEASMHVAYVKDIRGRQIFFQRSEQGERTIWIYPMGEKGKFEQVTPAGVSAGFFACSSDYYLVYQSGTGTQASLYGVRARPGKKDTPVKLFTYGENVTHVRLTQDFEKLIFVKIVADTDGDGFILSLKDAAQIWAVDIMNRQR